MSGSRVPPPARTPAWLLQPRAAGATALPELHKAGSSLPSTSSRKGGHRETAAPPAVALSAPSTCSPLAVSRSPRFQHNSVWVDFLSLMPFLSLFCDNSSHFYIFLGYSEDGMSVHLICWRAAPAAGKLIAPRGLLQSTDTS